jgi:formate dehydrogenase major subunit
MNAQKSSMNPPKRAAQADPVASWGERGASSQNPFSIELDGVQVTANPGETILQVARRHGAADRIPTLCEEPGLPHQTSCFVCVVEVEGMGKLTPACSTPAAPNMKVRTSTPRVESSRRTALELIVSNHPADCIGPCVRGCPAGVDAQKYVALVHAGRFEEAVRTIRQNNPLIAVCGRVCVRKCEDACRRALLEGAVGVNMAKRFVGDWELAHPVSDAPAADSGKKVAVVGGGPAGLTAAYYLRLAGHAVDLFEAQPTLGGMLRYGIPDYRLPDAVLDHEIDHILNLGVKAHVGQALGRDYTLDGLRERYDGVFLGIGAWLGMPARIPGEEHPACLSGVEFLRNVKLGQAPDLRGKRVAVVGGGNTAIDAARVAVRLGAAEVKLLYRRTRAEMPAHPEEVHGAEVEGVQLNLLCAPVRVEVQGERFQGIVCQRMELGEPDSSGRRRPVAVPGSDYLVEVDVAIMAIGQKVDLSGLAKGTAPAFSRWSTLEADPKTGTTNLPGVFAAGDGVTGPQVVVDAIGSAHHAADSLDAWLRTGEAPQPQAMFDNQLELYRKASRASLPPMPEAQRAHQLEDAPADRVASFAEVEHTLTWEQVQAETARCLRCGCGAQETCTLRQLAQRYGLAHSFAGVAQDHQVDRSNPLVWFEPNKCILCARCIRICGDGMGVDALGFIARGFDTVVAPSMGKPLAESPCISCGNCVEACPTGALTYANPADMTPATSEAVTTCLLCGNGCELKVRETPYGLSVRAVRDADDVLQPLCAWGRFGYRSLLDEERLTAPLVRRDGALVPASWEEALDRAADGLRAAVRQAGSDAVMVSVAPDATGEEALAAARLADALGTHNLASLTEAFSGSGVLAANEGDEVLSSSASFEDLDQAALILWVGTDPSVENPVLAARLRRALRNGARLITLGAGRTRLSRKASVAVRAKAGTLGQVIGWWLAEGARRGCPERRAALSFLPESVKALTAEGVAAATGATAQSLNAALDLLLALDAGSLVCVISADGVGEAVPADLELLRALTHGLAYARKAGLLLLRATANPVGMRLAGVRTRAAAVGLTRGGLTAAWTLGEDVANLCGPGGQRPGFLVVQDVALTDTARMADVVFPRTLHLETGGTVVRADGQVLRLPAVVPSRVEFTSVQVLEAMVARANPIMAVVTDSFEADADLWGRQRYVPPAPEHRPHELGALSVEPASARLSGMAERVKRELGRTGR